MKVTFVLFLLIALILVVYSLHPKRYEPFCAVTGYTYDDPCPIPDITNIADISRSPPFYDLNAVRPPSCSYKNFTYPPPMDYDPIVCPKPEIRYHYWDTAMLSHPQTPYVV